MKNQFLAAALVAVLPTISVAQGIEHLGSEFGLGYSSTEFDNSSDTASGMTVSIKTDWALGANFGVQVNGSARDIDFGSIQTLGLHGWYQISPIVRLGAFAQQENFSINGAPGGLSSRLFGLEALVEPVENASIQIYAGRGQSEADFIGGSFDLTSYGMSATYDLSQAVSGRISFDRGSQDIMGTTVDADTMGFGIDWRTKGLGNVPLTIAFDYMHISSSFDNADRIGVTAKIAIGNSSETPRRLFNDRYAPAFTLVF